jgi:hypothetical protein
MSKERYNQIIDEVYDNYRAKVKLSQIPTDLTKEEFVELCKNDITFSVYWGLKLEERELTPKERIELAGGKIQDKYPALVEMSLKVCDERDIPTKLITLTYNNETIESYD